MKLEKISFVSDFLQAFYVTRKSLEFLRVFLLKRKGRRLRAIVYGFNVHARAHTRTFIDAHTRRRVKSSAF